jgi:hypothetical protein
VKIECDEGGAWMVVLTTLVAGISACFLIGLAGSDAVKVTCHRAQIAAYAASAPKIPECAK